MKYIIAILVLVGYAAAQQDPASSGRALAEALEQRGIALIERTRKDLDDLRKNDSAHLVDGLEHQLVLVEALVMDLKVQLAQKDIVFHLHHIHVIEEDLLHLENAIFDELSIINRVRTTPVDPTKPKPVQNELVTKGENLIKMAEEALLHHSNTREARAIQREVEAIQSLIKLINGKPSADDLKKDEETIQRHEASLQVLLEKAANRPTN